MKTVDQIAQEIVVREGGYVDDPDDPGGVTNLGVTLKTLKRLGIDLDNDGDTDRMDLRKLTPKDAAKIFKTHYFEQPGIARLPAMIRPSVFDMYVNAGGNAVKILQRLIAKFGPEVTVDGAIGPQTVRAAQQVAALAPNHFNDAYGIERRIYYYRLGDKRPPLRKFARRRDGGKGGWIKRAEDFMAARYHFTDAQHQERTAKWG